MLPLPVSRFSSPVLLKLYLYIKSSVDIYPALCWRRLAPPSKTFFDLPTLRCSAAAGEVYVCRDGLHQPSGLTPPMLCYFAQFTAGLYYQLPQRLNVRVPWEEDGSLASHPTGGVQQGQPVQATEV